MENDTFEVEKSELVEFTLEKMKKLREVQQLIHKYRIFYKGGGVRPFHQHKATLL